MLNKSKGNMYPWVTHTWNPIKGKCPHKCTYCYMNGFPQNELHLDDKVLKDDLGIENIIFVGSSTDMWADSVPPDWLRQVLQHCRQYDNTYLFQTKNVTRWMNWRSLYEFPGVSKVCEPLGRTIIGTTIESNIEHNISLAIPTKDRYQAMTLLECFPKMVSIEPIMDFDLDVMVLWMRKIKPEFISIGADSKGHNLPEPSSVKIQELIYELQKFTIVKVKSNLDRLLKVQEIPV